MPPVGGRRGMPFVCSRIDGVQNFGSSPPPSTSVQLWADSFARPVQHGDKLAAELRATEEDVPYRKYGKKRLGAGPPSNQTDYAIMTCRSSQGDMNRMDESAFARLDGVILTLPKQPAPRGCLPLNWLLPDLRIIRKAGCVVVYAIDKAKRLGILRTGYDISSPLGKHTGFPRTQVAPASKPKPARTSAYRRPSPIGLDWQDGYSGRQPYRSRLGAGCKQTQTQPNGLWTFCIWKGAPSQVKTAMKRRIRQGTRNYRKTVPPAGKRRGLPTLSSH